MKATIYFSDGSKQEQFLKGIKAMDDWLTILANDEKTIQINVKHKIVGVKKVMLEWP